MPGLCVQIRMWSTPPVTAGWRSCQAGGRGAPLVDDRNRGRTGLLCTGIAGTILKGVSNVCGGGRGKMSVFIGGIEPSHPRGGVIFLIPNLMHPPCSVASLYVIPNDLHVCLR